jgi:hypothetical protein
MKTQKHEMRKKHKRGRHESTKALSQLKIENEGKSESTKGGGRGGESGEKKVHRTSTWITSCKRSADRGEKVSSLT